jgi:integrase
MDQRIANLPALPDADLQSLAADFARAARSAATERGYASDWRDFERWCQVNRYQPIPATPQTIGLYLTDRAKTLKVATLKRRLVTITQAQRLAGHPVDTQDPALRDVFAGIRRVIGAKQTPKQALVTQELRAVLKALPSGLVGARDRAILLVAFAGALRRSELVALDVGDLTFAADGVVLDLGKTKTDQEGIGQRVGLPRGRKDDPAEAVQIWLRIARITEGAVFRAIDRRGVVGERLSGEAVAKIVKRAVARIGLDPSLYAGHSLRSGFCTSASQGGAELVNIAQHARHRRLETTAGYVQHAKILRNPAARATGL